jgi:hypothetical protein
MPLTDQQKRMLDSDPMSYLQKRLNLVSHAEIENALADALESLVGGHYKIRITNWSESRIPHGIGESLEMCAVITGELEGRKGPFAATEDPEQNSPAAQA